jgi:formylglycine-generating enzyme required for sulfatase activity
VSEWTSTRYDALAYSGGSPQDEPPEDEPLYRVLRGGSWADAAAAVTVSFRSAALGPAWQQGWDSFTPNVGFRLVRRVRGR